MLDVGLNFFFPDGMGLTGEQTVGGRDSYGGGKPSRRPPQTLMKTKDGYGALMVWPEAAHFVAHSKPSSLSSRDIRFSDFDAKRDPSRIPCHAR